MFEVSSRVLTRKDYQKMIETGNITLTPSQLANLGCALFRGVPEDEPCDILLALGLVKHVWNGSDSVLSITERGKEVLTEIGLVKVVRTLLDNQYKRCALRYIREVLPDVGMLTEFLVNSDSDVRETAETVLDFLNWVKETSSKFWWEYPQKG